MQDGDRVLGKLEAADVAVAEAAAVQRDNPIVRVVGLASEIADQAPLYGLSGAVLAVGLVTGKRALARTGARMVAAHSIAALAKMAVKRAVGRTRPHMLVDHDRYEVEAFGPTGSDHNSFPSGHTAGAVAVARAASRGNPHVAAPAAVAASAAALIQVPRCRHYPSDLAAGAVIGFVAELVGSRLVDWWWAKGGDEEIDSGEAKP